MLSKGIYGPSQIMAVTGHKSVQSLTVYQRVDEEEKLRMGQSISEAMLPSASKQLALPAPTVMALPSTAGTQLALPALTSQPSTEPVVVSVPQSADATKYLEGICLNELFDDFVNSSANVSHTAMQRNQKNPTVFSNCQFTINFNVSKQ